MTSMAVALDRNLVLAYYSTYSYWLVGFPVLTRAYDNNGRCPRQKLVFGILQLYYYWLVGWFPNLTRAYDNNGRCPRQKFVFGILQLFSLVGWFPNLTRAYDNNGRCPRQKFVFGILQLVQLGLCPVLFVARLVALKLVSNELLLLIGKRASLILTIRRIQWIWIGHLFK